MQDPKKLNDEQQKTVHCSDDGPVLVLAGAGTGKTMALTHRIAHLIKSGQAKPEEILAVTFTKKAADEMRERIAELLSIKPPEWLGTFHRLSGRMLRKYLEGQGAGEESVVPLPSGFEIYSESDSIRAVASIIKDLRRSDEKLSTLSEQEWDNKKKKVIWQPRYIANKLIAKCKDRRMAPTDSDFAKFAEDAEVEFPVIYNKYEELLRDAEAADFSDMLEYMNKVFSACAKTKEYWRAKFKYVLVDEFQDVNLTQLDWLKHVSRDGNNIWCVGDDYQAIYGWRGADVRYIQEFKNSFGVGDCNIFRLEQNYRSTPQIVKVGEYVAGQIKGGWPKSLNPRPEIKKEECRPVRIVEFENASDEAKWIVAEIERLTDPEGEECLDRGDIAILGRTSKLLKPIRESLQTAEIKCGKIEEPRRSSDNPTIRAVVEHMKVVAPPEHYDGFGAFVHVAMFRGLGQDTIHAIKGEFSREDDIGPTAAARMVLDGKMIKEHDEHQILDDLLKKIEKWHDDYARDRSLIKLLESIFDELGVRHSTEEGNGSSDKHGQVRKGLIEKAEQCTDVRQFLKKVEFDMDKHSREESPNTEAVNIMTIHAAKGLEFKAVFLPSWDNFIIHRERKDEDFCVAHVAITRAKKLLNVSWSRHRPPKSDIAQSIAKCLKKAEQELAGYIVYERRGTSN